MSMGGSSSGDDFDVDGDVEGNQVGDKFRKVNKIILILFYFFGNFENS